MTALRRDSPRKQEQRTHAQHLPTERCSTQRPGAKIMLKQKILKFSSEEILKLTLNRLDQRRKLSFQGATRRLQMRMPKLKTKEKIRNST